MEPEWRDWKTEGRIVASMAARNRKFRASAQIVAGAVTDVYEREAALLLEASAPRAAELGMTAEQHREEVSLHLLWRAAETWAEALRREQAAGGAVVRRKRSRR